MPYVNIKVTREAVTTKHKQALIRGVTDLLVKVLAELEDELARQRAHIDLPAGRELYVGSHGALNY